MPGTMMKKNMMKKRMMKKGGGALKSVPADNKGLPNLPKQVRNKMGFMKSGGRVKKMYGGKVKKK